MTTVLHILVVIVAAVACALAVAGVGAAVFLWWVTKTWGKGT